MYAVLLNPPRKKKRSKRRGKRKKLSHACRSHIARRAAKKRKVRKSVKRTAKRKPRRRKKKVYVAAPFGVPAAYASNPRRRRRRRRKARNYSHWIPAYANNPGKKRKRRARYNYGRKYRRKKSRNYSHWIPAYANNPSWVPSYAMNPRGNVVGTVTKGFSPAVLKKAAPVVGGAILNTTIGRYISKFLPDMFQTGALNIVVNLGTAGVMGAGVGLLSPAMSTPVFFGGVVEALMRAVHEYVMPAIGMSGCSGCGLGETSDWASAMHTASFLPSFAQATGLNRALPTAYGQSPVSPYPYGMQGMGDYLTRSNAASARPLGDYLSRSDAASARALGTIDGIASTELSVS